LSTWMARRWMVGEFVAILGQDHIAETMMGECDSCQHEGEVTRHNPRNGTGTVDLCALCYCTPAAGAHVYDTEAHDMHRTIITTGWAVIAAVRRMLTEAGVAVSRGHEADDMASRYCRCTGCRAVWKVAHRDRAWCPVCESELRERATGDEWRSQVRGGDGG
jgi:ssDNA-binding Zn-finger/Zn-ribbon topoisomerase 1